jgi:hypothetical protein
MQNTKNHSKKYEDGVFRMKKDEEMKGEGTKRIRHLVYEK